jgi:hypothetical protein
MPSTESAKWFVSESRRKIRLRAVTYLGGCCFKCGYNKSIAALDFHHKDPSEKDFQISSGKYRRWELIRPELDKCVLLCANCHREVHADLRTESQARLAERVRSDHEPKHPPVVVHCVICKATMKTVYSKSLKQTEFYCSQECFHRSREKAAWPSNEELFKMVWKKPALTVAKELGVSAPALKKRCRSRGIETPPRGYWQKQWSGNTAPTISPV